MCEGGSDRGGDEHQSTAEDDATAAEIPIHGVGEPATQSRRTEIRSRVDNTDKPLVATSRFTNAEFNREGQICTI